MMPLRRQAQGLGRLAGLAAVLLVAGTLFYWLSHGLLDKRLNWTPVADFGLSLDSLKGGAVDPSCEDRFELNYLKSFRNSHAQYCETDLSKPPSQSRMTCFSNNVDPNRIRTDSFCVAGPAIYNVDTQKYDLNCQLKTLTQDEITRGAQSFNHFPAYWYQTGPRFIFEHYLNLNAGDSIVKGPLPEGAPTVILIKRENANFNMWHSLLEIMSAYWSLLVLAQTIDPDTGLPLYSNSEQTTIVILDGIADGPYFDLWSLVTPTSPSRRYPDAAPTSTRHSVLVGKLIIPLSGGSNPFWQGDWADVNCTSSTLLDDFSRKALAHYDIKLNVKYGMPITITYIDRVTKRRLINQDTHIAALRRAHPYVTVNVVDYASYTFEEQLKISASTNILVGVHGAGLTHVMFMPQQSAIVEIMPFNLDYHGFRNMAKMRSIGYSQAKTEDRREETHAKGDWQEDDVWITEESFLSTIGEAIQDLQKKRNGG